MAHWISSKLKAAETLLQQIDQQAADSLKKSEKETTDDPLVVETSSKSPETSSKSPETSSKSPETKSLIKDQLKKKSTENVLSQSIAPSHNRDLNSFSRSNSDVNKNVEAERSPNLNPKPNLSPGLTDSDWTELLSVPDKRPVSGAGVTSQGSNRVPVTRALKKNGKKAGNSGKGLNLSVVDGRNEKVGNNEVLKSSRKSNVGSESNTGADSNEKTSIFGDATPRTSSFQSVSSGGESNERNNMGTTKSGTLEGVNDIVDVEKLILLNDNNPSSQMTSVSLDKKLDMEVELNVSDRPETTISGTISSKIGPRGSSSKKKVLPLPSEVDSNSETDTSSSDSESEREREERRKRKQQILAEKAAAKAIEAIKERENMVARLEGEKQSLEKMFEERAIQQVQEASELQTTMMETMDAVELEKQKHNNTRMEALARLAKLESLNADLARSFANVQKSLEVEADRIAELRHQIQMKESTLEDLRREISNTHQNGDALRASKGAEFEMEMLEAEYSFVTDKVARMQTQAKTLETSIETTRREIEDPSEVEIELKRRLSQLTDHLIQKQAQVETPSSEKAMLLLRIEAVSKLLDEQGPADFPSTSSRDELDQGTWHLSNSKFRFLRRNSTARAWSLVYLACLHLWVVYILMSHAPVTDDTRSGAVISLENINNTGGGV
ncbi:golgin candidate 2-like isoform X2 [Salvia splendens]|uniref:golgin candidate 2-like isoform X2 n=1 Tax=Salvia splendens TaxID=180675 RepID=UPI001C266DE7|nr:golgin candidate 2-like isoform X2 [Salvia splendens]